MLKSPFGLVLTPSKLWEEQWGKDIILGENAPIPQEQEHARLLGLEVKVAFIF